MSESVTWTPQQSDAIVDCWILPGGLMLARLPDGSVVQSKDAESWEPLDDAPRIRPLPEHPATSE